MDPSLSTIAEGHGQHLGDGTH
ncbi:MAG: hypothetical protein H6Q84_1440, partial [Deltaproteobacteria bacterium]|nr:hypothetical protein [Deltaproteobacteria bacterium]